MARPPTDPAIVQIAVDYARTGMSHDDIAEAMRAAGYRVSAASVGNWARKAGVRPGVVPVATPAAPPDDDPPDDGTVDDEIRNLRKMQRDLQRDAETARSMGNMTAAQRAMSASAALAPVIARLLRASKDERDVLRIPRSELDSARAKHRERIRALLDRPLLCAECSRKLSIDWAGVSEAEPSAADKPPKV